MTKLNIHEAKTHLSRYLPRIQAGESFTLCKNNQPIALIVPFPKKKRSREMLFGLGKKMGNVSQSFFDPLTDAELPGFGI